MIFFRTLGGFLLQVIPFAFLCFYPFPDYFRYTKRQTVIGTIGLITLLATLFSAVTVYLNATMPQDYSLWQAVNLVFMCCLLPCLAWYLYAIKVIWQKKLFVFSFSATCALAMTSVCNIIVTKIILYDDDAWLPYYGCGLPVLLGVTILAMPLFWLLLERAYHPVQGSLNSRESGYLSVMSIVLAAILASGLSFIGIDRLLNPMSLFLFFALMISVFVIYFAIFKMLAHAHEKLETMQKYVEVQHQLAIHEEQYRRIHDNIESSRRMRHDLRHHMVTLQGFLSNGDLGKAEEYLGQYVTLSDDYTLVKFCDNPVVNMLVSHYQGAAKEKGITFTVRIHIPSKISISDSDISVLIGNLLENAIEASNRASEGNRYISFNMICSGKMLAITVDNGFDGGIKTDGTAYLSSKNDHVGLGLKSIESIAAKYDGGVEFTHENMAFHSSVMIGGL